MLHRRLDLAGLVGGAMLLATAAAARRGVTQTEARVFRLANELPDEAFRAIWLPMQYGTFATVPVLAGLALVRQRPRLAAALGVSGTTAWVLGKAIKPMVGRGRPAGALSNVHVRGKEEGDLGFPSGHAAVAAGLTMVAWPYISRKWRLLTVAISAFVPFARMYVGAHLPLDVVGGSALGMTIGSAVILAAARGNDQAGAAPAEESALDRVDSARHSKARGSSRRAAES
jgi:glycosyltransferase 2 family protein